MSRRNVIAIAVIAITVGLLVGWFAGRAALERAWAEPRTIGEDDVRRSSEGDADATPAAGTVVIPAMPLRRSRVALREIAGGDPVRMRVGAIGRSDGEMFLHLTFVNDGACPVREVEGVAYGFDARGHSARMNRGGEHYVAFHVEEMELAPGGSSFQELTLHHPDVASIALAQVDRVTCADGTTWARD